MRFYMFKSQAKPGLNAFAEDGTGTKLPQQFAPWLVTGVVKPDAKPPHNLPRAPIEEALKERGFQLWRKTVPATDA
jgi:hypothetical protein